MQALFLSTEIEDLSGLCVWVQYMEMGKVNGAFPFFLIYNCFWTVISVFGGKASLSEATLIVGY